MKTGSDTDRAVGDGADRGSVTVRGHAVATDLVFEQVTTREAADRLHSIEHESFEADYYELPARPVKEIYERIESSRTDERAELWLGYIGTRAGGAGTPVVLGDLRLPLLDNIDNAVVNVCTRPAFRRRGYGTAMLKHITARAQEHGRTRLIGEIGESGPLDSAGEPIGLGEAELDPADHASPAPQPAVLFATKAGARPVTAEVRRLLRIRDIDDAELSRLRADATSHSADYSLLQWVGPAPDHFVDDLVALHSRMTIDAPLEELDWEPEQWTPERYREREERVTASGQACLSTAARHDPSGQIVALTEIGVEWGQPHIAYQWLTIVLPTHRGHRLGMLVKLANLEFVRTGQPLVQMLNTWNAAINDHMVGINEAMGFRPVERWREWQLELPSPTI